MGNYQGNSNKSKEAQKKKVEPVVKKRARTKKRGPVSRIFNSLIVDDARDHVVEDLVVPMINNTIMGIAGYFFGGNKVSSNSSKTSYGNYYKEKDGRSTRRSSSIRNFDYSDIILDERVEAEAVLRGMEEILKHYPIVSVSDLYELANIPTDNWTGNKYGWTDVRNARIVRVADGYMIRMPRPMPID